MATFTPQELRTVAQRIMPVINGGGWEYSKTLGGKISGVESQKHNEEYFIDDFDPETNHEQWRKLAEWCADRGIVVFLDGEHTAYQVQSDGNLSHIVREDGSQLFNVLARGNTHTDCMIAAVLAHKQSSESGEVDCG